MGKVVAIYQGKDQLVRAADIQVETLTKSPLSNSTKKKNSSQYKTWTAVYRRPISKLALLVSAEEAHTPPEGSDEGIS